VGWGKEKQFSYARVGIRRNWTAFDARLPSNFILCGLPHISENANAPNRNRFGVSRFLKIFTADDRGIFYVETGHGYAVLLFSTKIDKTKPRPKTVGYGG
jgi:hypothetical protein